MEKNREFILQKYTTLKLFRHPLDGKSLSKKDRIKVLVDVLLDNDLGARYTNEDKLLANKCIEMILNEQDNGN